MKLYFITCICLLAVVFQFAGCSKFPAPILENYAAHYYYHERLPGRHYGNAMYLQVKCDFYAPEDIYLSFVNFYMKFEKADLYKISVGFNKNYKPDMSWYSKYNNYYGIIINGIDANKIESNYVKKGSLIEVIFPVFGGQKIFAHSFYSEYDDDWVVTMEATKSDGSELSNFSVFDNN